VLADEPVEPEPLPDLLVGRRDEDEVAATAPSLPRERGQRNRARRHLPLHVERPSAPDEPVAELAAERVDAPLARIRRNDVRVREQRERLAAAGAADPRDEVRPLGRPRVLLALDTRVLEVGAEELGRRGLVAGRIRGVETDQLPQELDRLVAQRRLPSDTR
jgi:hypothetical protein